MQSLSKEEKTHIRSILFRHLDGIAVIPSCIQLEKKGILRSFNTKTTQSLNDISTNTHSNDAYINVALRLCSSQGWLEQKIADNNIFFSLTDRGKVFLSQIKAFDNAIPILPHLSDFSRLCKEHSGLIEDYIKALFTLHAKLNEQLFHQMCGLIIGPLLVHWGIKSHLKNQNPLNTKDLPGGMLANIPLFSLMKLIGWGDIQDETFFPNVIGNAFFKRCSAYGVTTSYLPMFNKLEDLFYGDPACLWKRPKNSPEIHVNRTMNVWGSGGAHSGYFNKVDEIVIEIFNRPLEDQPAGIADMGCGNGALLAHLFELIEHYTLRGKHLDTHYLHLIGADLNKAALDSSKKNLLERGIEAEFLYADISDPAQYAKDLKALFNVNLEDLLNVRSFLDHNRIYEKPSAFKRTDKSLSTGSFAYRGRLIPNDELEYNLIQHFKKWAPFIKSFGLILIELHTIPPVLAAKNIGKTSVTAYDGTHGYSDQYIIEKDLFLQCAAQAGLRPNPKFMFSFPPNDCATISINIIK